jgi:hypothetical protein
MVRFIKAATGLIFVALLACLVLPGCAGKRIKPGEVAPCVPEAKLEKEISPEARLEDLSCTLKKWEGSDTLHFSVTVKNISSRPRRYRVHIFLDNGKAVGGLIPRKTKKGLVEPGQSASFEYPVKGMVCLPGSLTVVIQTMQP